MSIVREAKNSFSMNHYGDESFSGRLLIASSHLDDENFRCTVVLIVQDNDAGTVGLILNRPVSKLSAFWKGVFGVKCPGQDYLFSGGPVMGPLVALHKDRALADVTVVPDWCLTFDKDRLASVLTDATGPVRYIVGQSGWTRPQLIDEIEQGYWFLLPSEQLPEVADFTELWLTTLGRYGRSSLARITGIPIFPSDPSVN